MTGTLEIHLRSNRDLDELVVALSSWWNEKVEPDAGTRIEDARYVTGSGAANESIIATLARPEHVSTELIVRLAVPRAKFQLDVDLERQVLLMEWVGQHSLPAPIVLAADYDGEIIGVPFVVMERIDGFVPNDYPGYNSAGELADLPPHERRQLWADAVGSLGRLHTTCPAPPWLDDAGTRGGGLRGLVRYWRENHDWVVEEHGALPVLSAALTELEATTPTRAPMGLSWGDARLGNMIFQDARCAGILDWEMASSGGPLVDLAWWLMWDEFFSDGLGARRLDGLGTRTQTIELWHATTGHDVSTLAWHDCFAQFVITLMRSRAYALRRESRAPTPESGDPRSLELSEARLVRLLGQL